MMASRLSKKQIALVEELRKIQEILEIDFEHIDQIPTDSRTAKLEVIKNKLIRGQIVVWYTIIDEFLTNRICRYFFGKKKSFIQLWKTKKFQNFNYYVIEKLSLLEKLRFVKAFSLIPKSISHIIEQLNVLRNGLAHSFFPENLRTSKPLWKGKNIFSIDGLNSLRDDMVKVFEQFLEDEDWY
jgi:hypothetical protein